MQMYEHHGTLLLIGIDFSRSKPLKMQSLKQQASYLSYTCHQSPRSHPRGALGQPS